MQSNVLCKPLLICYLSIGKTASSFHRSWLAVDTLQLTCPEFYPSWLWLLYWLLIQSKRQNNLKAIVEPFLGLCNGGKQVILRLELELNILFPWSVCFLPLTMRNLMTACWWSNWIESSLRAKIVSLVSLYLKFAQSLAQFTVIP